MTDGQKKADDVLSPLPEALAAKLRAANGDEPAQAAARYDLDGAGRYLDGCLVLTDRRIGSFVRRDGAWDEQWLATERLGGAVLIEGLGMGLLRLLVDGAVAAEYRFSQRHAKEVARLQRRLERRIEKKEEADSPDEPRGDEKKVRCDKCQRVIPPWSEMCPACLSRRKVLSRLLDFVKPYKWQAVTGFVLAVLFTLAGLLRPGLVKPMFDRGLGTATGRPDYRLLLILVAQLAGLMVFQSLASAVRQRLMAVLAARVGRDIRLRTYEHLHKLSLSFFSKKPTGSLVTRITNDSDRIWDFVAFTVIESVISTLTVLGVAVAMIVLDWRLACIVLLPVPLMLLLTVVFHRKLHGGFDRLFHRWSMMTAVVADALPGVRVIKAFSQEKREVDRFGVKNSDVYAGEIGMISLWTLFEPVVQFCTHIGTLLVWIVGGWWAVTGRMTPGTLMAYMMYMGMFYGPIHMIAHIDRMLNRAAASVQRIFEVLDTEPGIYSKSAARPVGELAGDIELRDVTFSYDGIRKVLRNVSLSVKAGEMIGLAGPSGGGKTTMVNLICRFYDVLEGSIRIDGVDVRDYNVEALRHRIGVVLQEPFLFHGTVAANVAYGNPDATIGQIIAASKAANAHDFIVGFPDGYDTVIGERGHTLSGGERQRISIARAILNNPRILILDEATSSVDTETEKLIQQALDRLIANRTTIAIAHRLSTLRKANRLVILDKGRVVEEGTHEELAAKDGGIYAKLLRMQSETQSIIAVGSG
ncbi:MAG: ABC transporter ATP-binding protein [Phycisphaerae bacterium]|nr:ABC transporter ATP-binding protein [Phycisphaerae bacterium]